VVKNFRLNLGSTGEEGSPPPGTGTPISAWLRVPIQHAAHVLGVDEDHRHAVGADPRLTGSQHRCALGPHVVAGGDDIWDLEADVMLAALRVLGQEAVDRRSLAVRLDQFDLGVRQVDERHPDPLLR
jgi:hypothetical protein